MDRTIVVPDEDFHVVSNALLVAHHEDFVEVRHGAEFYNHGWAMTEFGIASKTSIGIVESNIRWTDDGHYEVSHEIAVARGGPAASHTGH